MNRPPPRPRPHRPPVLFRVAGGPRQGFGHLVRVLHLARALGVTPLLSVRGGVRAVAAARGLGARPAPASLRAALRLSPGLVVVDDPSERHAGGWIAACRRGGIPVASLHDLGLGADGADLIVDGSIGARRRRWQGPRQLVGPQYCIVSPDLVRRRGVRGARSAASSVLIALGGGPRTGVALRLGRALTELAADLRVIVAGGFVAEKPASLHARVEWLASPVQFQSAMQEATVVVAGGGLTLYECCAAGTPAVAVSVVAAQRPAVAGLARAGAALDAGALPVTRQRLDEVARLTCELVSDAVARHRLVARGREVVDGRGLERVCRALRQLLGERRRRSRAVPARGGASR